MPSVASTKAISQLCNTCSGGVTLAASCLYTCIDRTALTLHQHSSTFADAAMAGAALAAFLLAAIPTLMSIRRTAQAVEATLYTLEREIPDTAAAVRLSSMELSDAIEEVSLLSNDLTQGLHSSAAAVTAAEQNIRQGAQFLDLGVRNVVIPSVKSRIPAAKGVMEAQLKETAQLQHEGPTVAELARSTKGIAGRIRFGLRVLNAFSRAAATRQVLTPRPAM